MKEGWVVKPLADVCQFFTDGDWIESKDQSTNGIRLIQTGNVGEGFFKDRSDKARFVSVDTFTRLRCTEIFEGDVLISRLPDPVGRSCILPPVGERMITAVDCSIIRFDRSRVLPEFFNYYSQSSSYLKRVSEACTGATRTRISRANLGSISIPITCIKEQYRIVAKLDEAFEAIASAKEKAEQNLLNARALFDSYLDDVFSKRGEGWRQDDRSLAELCELIVDCEHKTAPTEKEGIPSIRTPNIGKGQLLLEGVYRVSEETYREWTRRAEPKAGDLILAREAPAGNVAVIPENARVCLGQRTVLLRPRTEIFNPVFLAEFLLQPSMQRVLMSHSRGATVQHINMKDIRALKVNAIPSFAIQQDIVLKLENIKSSISELESLYQQKLNALDELKQSLLHQAFSGEL